MLTIFLIHVLITLVCFAAGALFYALIPQPSGQANKPMLFYLITGLITLTIAAQVVVLFLPLNALVSNSLIGLTMVAFAFAKNRVRSALIQLVNRLQSVSRIQWICMLSAWFMILVFNAGPTRMDDTESYHIQMVKWIHEFGTVPGIVNLHERYGFNSSWFSSTSLFLFSDASPVSYTAVNGVLSLWFCIFLINKIGAKTPGPGIGRIGWLIVLLMAVYCWPMLRNNPATANYDFIAALLTLVLFVHTIHSTTRSSYYIEWLLWPIYLFTVRIINYPLLILSAISFFYAIRHKQWKIVGWQITFAACLILPFLIRNVILSGYPFYPSPAFDLFNVDWKADPEMMVKLNEFIKYYNRVNVTYMEIEATREIPFPSWLLTWFRYIYYFDKPLLVTGIAGIIGSIFFIKKLNRHFGSAISVWLMVMIVQIASWLFVAPDPRFIYGVLLCGLYLLLAMIFGTNRQRKDTIRPVFLLLLVAIGFVGYAALKVIREKEFRNFVSVHPLPKPPLTKVEVDGIEMFIPEAILNNWNPRCYDTKLPCLYIVDPNLKPRGKSVSDGFRLNK